MERSKDEDGKARAPMNVTNLEQSMDVFLYGLEGYEKSEYVWIMPYKLEKPLSRKSDLLRHKFVLVRRDNRYVQEDIKSGHNCYSAPYLDDMSIPHLKRIGVIKEPIVIRL